MNSALRIYWRLVDLCWISFALLLFLLTLPLRAQQASVADFSPANDAKEIVRRSLEIEKSTADLVRNYTYQQREVRKHLGPHGEVKSSIVKTWDVTNLYGEPYSRLIQRDDEPLSASDEKGEEEKEQKFLRKRKDESFEARQKRQASEKKERDEERAFVHDVVNAYDFRTAGQETMNGRAAWVIEATPRKDFHPTQPHAGMLSKLQGKVWIDKEDYTWVKVEAEAVDTISLGLLIARIHKGSHFSIEQVRVNDEVWLMRRLYVDAAARVLLVSNRDVQVEDTFFNYKRFTTTTKILPGVREVNPK